jgi:hypothetical protein
MIEWLINQGLGMILGFIGFALIYPIYKAGFFVRQGLAYKKDLAQVDVKLSQGNTLTAEGEKAYKSGATKSLIMLIAAPGFILLVCVLLMIFTGWWMAGLALAVAICGYINVNS